MTTTLGGPDQKGSLPGLPDAEAAALAERFGMTKVGLRPRLGAYLVDLWRSRHLIWSLSKGNFVAAHQDNNLGLLWSVLNPLLLAGVYYLIFGVLIGGVRAGIDNFVSFLTLGLFTYTFLSACLTTGSKSLVGKMGMVRALQFPRVLLPITVVLSELLEAIPAFLILLLVALGSGEHVSLEWLAYPAALLIVAVMGLGLALIGTRIMHTVRDAANLIPLATRMLRYISGLFFSIDHQTERLARHGHSTIAFLLEYQPIAVALNVVREPISGQLPLRWETWVAASAWALVLFLSGFWLFWRAEGSYGRD